MQFDRQFRASVEWATFLAEYRRWVADVVVPLVGDPRGVVFQCPPTLRVSDLAAQRTAVSTLSRGRTMGWKFW
jgi:hypothetical protein